MRKPALPKELNIPAQGPLIRQVSAFAVRRLKKAFDFQFSHPLTGYLTGACIKARCCVGLTHRHAKAEPGSGRNCEGRLIRTSDIIRIEREGVFLILCTIRGSNYVIMPVHSHSGY